MCFRYMYMVDSLSIICKLTLAPLKHSLKPSYPVYSHYAKCMLIIAILFLKIVIRVLFLPTLQN